MKKTLMYVSEVNAEGLTLSSYGNEGIFFPFNLPIEVLRSMRGRQCWVKGECGGKCEIEYWLPLPTYEEGAA